MDADDADFRPEVALMGLSNSQPAAGGPALAPAAPPSAVGGDLDLEPAFPA